MREYERGWKEAYEEVNSDFSEDNKDEAGPPPTEPTPEMRENAAAEVERQIEEHVAEREHGEADVE